jgi:hypothetical protein
VSGYLYTYDLVEPQPYAGAMQEEFMGDVEKARPEFLVVINMPTSWTMWVNVNATLSDWVRSYPAAYYDLIGVTEIYPARAESRWGKERAAEQPKTYSAIFVFKRR